MRPAAPSFNSRCLLIRRADFLAIEHAECEGDYTFKQMKSFSA